MESMTSSLDQRQSTPTASMSDLSPNEDSAHVEIALEQGTSNTVVSDASASDASVTDTSSSDQATASEEIPGTGDLSQQVQLKQTDQGLQIVLPIAPKLSEDIELPQEVIWEGLWQQLQQRLNGQERLWPDEGLDVEIVMQNQLLDSRRLHEVTHRLKEFKLRVKRIYTTRRQTAVAAATAGYSVEQQSSIQKLRHEVETDTTPYVATPLYVQTTLRSGTEIRHPGTVVVCGDVNPGSSIVADGDILVWGRLRSTVHAGASGNAKCVIMALRLEPILLRIADVMARGPESSPEVWHPEVAHVTPQGIRITRAEKFTRA